MFLRLVIMHQLEHKHDQTPFDQARLFLALSCLLQKQSVQNWEDISELLQDIMTRISDGNDFNPLLLQRSNEEIGMNDDSRTQLRKLARAHQVVPSLCYMVGNWHSTESLQSIQRGKMVDFTMKTWERIEEPAVQMSDNDTCLGLGLFKARRT